MIDIEKIVWIRICRSLGALTSEVLTSRMLLMHIAVDQGAAAGLNFVSYLDYSVDDHYSPPNGGLG
jgi:hypothetical protein